MRFTVGRNNLAATIFVPYDCGNNCPFCTTKKEYSDTRKFDLEKIISQIKAINKMSCVTDVVFTGGEPFADIASLSEMVLAVSATKNVYINTTLPFNTARQAVDFINTVEKIKGVNISRHIDKFISTKSDIFIPEIIKPKRINCVLYRDYTNEQLLDFIDLYSGRNRIINFRADYTKINHMTLRDPNTAFIKTLCSMGLSYMNTSGCLVCNTDYFLTPGRYTVAYHRGIEHSCVIFGDNIVVNDIIIKQDGNIYYDWDGKDINIELMLETFSDAPKPITPKSDVPKKKAKQELVVERQDARVYGLENPERFYEPSVSSNCNPICSLPLGGGRCGGGLGRC